MVFKLIFFISGGGSNLQYIIDKIKEGDLNAKIELVISNKKNAYGLERAKKHNIPYIYVPFYKAKDTRLSYDMRLSDILDKYNYDLIVCAGWMRILTAEFIEKHPKIINIHPALPNTFIGAHCKEDAYNAFKRGEITTAGGMCHWVIPEIDAGKVISYFKFELTKNMTFKNIKDILEFKEKPNLLKSIKLIMTEGQSNFSISTTPEYTGKVRDIYNVDCYNSKYLMLVQTDRLSAFDKNICDVGGKGHLLTDMSAWWFRNTRHLIPNHYLLHNGNTMLVKRCEPIKLEFIVRGYITGSMWRHYNQGNREFCGITLQDGLVKNQRLSEVIITPTTKGDVDEPISAQEIVERGYLTEQQLKQVCNYCLNLFSVGEKVSNEAGLILVDTKYEFGFDSDGSIILMDEVHTGDSSRFWKAENYNERFQAGEAPLSFDKDGVRNYLLENNLQEQDNVEVPNDVRDSVFTAYQGLYQMLTSDNETQFNPFNSETLRETQMELFNNYLAIDRVVIMAGSTKDREHVMKIASFLMKMNVYIEVIYSSAHKETMVVWNHLKRIEDLHSRVIFVTVAGRSNALSGVVASNTKFPVIACPPFKDKVDMMVNINSTLQCPSNVPVMTILEPQNVALSIYKMFNL